MLNFLPVAQSQAKVNSDIAKVATELQLADMVIEEI
jgi:hypothetical protein